MTRWVKQNMKSVKWTIFPSNSGSFSINAPFFLKIFCDCYNQKSCWILGEQKGLAMHLGSCFTVQCKLRKSSMKVQWWFQSWRSFKEYAEMSLGQNKSHTMIQTLCRNIRVPQAVQVELHQKSGGRKETWGKVMTKI